MEESGTSSRRYQCCMCRHLLTVKCPFCCQINLGIIQRQPSESLYLLETHHHLHEIAAAAPEEIAISVHDHLLINQTIIQPNTNTTDGTVSVWPWEWTFLLTNLGLEIVSAAFDQLSSPHKPLLALIAMVVSLLAVVVCVLELVHKARHQGVVLRRLNLIIWCFYYPSSAAAAAASNNYRLFWSFVDVYGLICSMSQFIFSAVKYRYLHHHTDDPIKFSILPVIFLACVAGSRLGKNRDADY